ncbi:MAG: hypothetical protein KatS3mg111_1794 [Pirellulaceae bacterium]|nr:MAG: hypothetical protein KatS3mg111_1794 [Pirellulaceae bacterium]
MGVAADSTVTQHDEAQTIAGRLIALCLLVFFAAQATRLAQIRSPTGETPFFSANDRSRWCTIAALSITGNYHIDPLLEIRDPKTRRRTWYTIDMVRHFGADGKLHYYSSKPPLLPTLYALVYMGVRSVTGLTLMEQPFVVVPIILLLVNLIPLTVFYAAALNWYCRRWVQRPRDYWHLLVLATFVTWGCFLSTFVTTLNNHLPAAIAAGVALWALHRIAVAAERGWRTFLLCGFASGFAAANELPALSWLVAAAALCGWHGRSKGVVGFMTGALPVAAAFFGTNYLAHGTWVPAYAQRSLGEKLAEFDVSEPIHDLERWIASPHGQQQILENLRNAGFTISEEAQLAVGRRSPVIEVLDEATATHLAIRLSPERHKAEVFQWNDWYDYPETYWTAGQKRGVDVGEPSRLTYAFHCLIGHHGILSLTPFWLLALIGAGQSVRIANLRQQFFNPSWQLAATAIVITCTVLVFYLLLRDQQDRNYGGIASGFRWTFWLIPLWLYLAAPALARLNGERALTRCAVGLALAISVFSATYPWSNPWTHPWIYQWLGN